MTIITTKGVYDTRTGRAGWAARVENEINGASRMICGVGSTITTAHQAEFAAIHGALVRGLKDRLIERMSRVEIRTNCRECIAVMLPNLAASRCIGPEVIEPSRKMTGRIWQFPPFGEIRRIVQENNLAIVYRVVGDPKVLEAARQAMMSAAA